MLLGFFCCWQDWGCRARLSTLLSRDVPSAECTSVGCSRQTSPATLSGWHCQGTWAARGTGGQQASSGCCLQLPMNKAWCPQVTPLCRPGRSAGGKGTGRGREGRGQQARGRVCGCPSPALLRGTVGCCRLAAACLWAAQGADAGRWGKPHPLAGAHSNPATSPNRTEATMRAGGRQPGGAPISTNPQLNPKSHHQCCHSDRLTRTMGDTTVLGLSLAAGLCSRH